MKLLIVASSLDLQQPFSSTPSWWQLGKGLYELGVDLIMSTYQGPAIETLWWRAMPNPVKAQGDVFKFLRDAARTIAGPQKQVQVESPDEVKPESLQERLIREIAQKTVAPLWKDALDKLLTDQPDIDAILFLTIPLNHVVGVAGYISDKYDIPVLYHDGDLPASLPKYKGFASGFRIYQGADLSEYAAIMGNSVGALEDVKALGAKNVHTFQYAADPDVWAPLNVDKDIDAFFYGHGKEYREDWINAMLTVPSEAMPDRRFAVRGLKMGEIGRAEMLPYLSHSKLREYVCRSKLNLVITRQAHASVYASSNGRPFELAALGACMVSSYFNGLEEWFEPGKEVIVLDSKEEAAERIAWLLDHDAERERIGQAARERLLKEHTYKHRAQELIDIMKLYM